MEKKLLKRTLGFLLAAGMVFSLSACSPGASASSAASSAAASSAASAAVSSSAGTLSNDPATITMLCSGDNTPPDSNNVLKEILKKTNITVKVTYVANKDLAAKLSALTASNDLPDLFKLTTASDLQKYKQNGAIADLTQYVKKMKYYYPDAKDVLSKCPVNTDGKIYGLFPLHEDYGTNLSIRTDWLKNVGLSMPTDLDSLYKVLDAFTNNDPDKDGKKDTFGLVASMNNTKNFWSIFGAYGVAADKPAILSDGTVTTFMKSSGYLDAVKYFNKLYQNGLMDPDFATIPTMDSFGKLWNGKAGVMDFQCVGTTNNWMPSRYTEAVTPTFDFAEIKGPNGKAGQPQKYPSYTNCSVVSAASKNAEAVVRLLDFFYSDEGDTLTRLGVEGLHFKWTDKENGKYEMLGQYTDSATNRNDGVFVYWQQFLCPKNNIEVRTFNKQTQQGVAQSDKLATLPWAYIFTAFDADTTYGTSLKAIEKEVFANLVTTTGDIEAEYKAGVARWESEGGSEWEKQATAAYKSQK